MKIILKDKKELEVERVVMDAMEKDDLTVTISMDVYKSVEEQYDSYFTDENVSSITIDDGETVIKKSYLRVYRNAIYILPTGSFVEVVLTNQTPEEKP